MGEFDDVDVKADFAAYRYYLLKELKRQAKKIEALENELGCLKVEMGILNAKAAGISAVIGGAVAVITKHIGG